MQILRLYEIQRNTIQHNTSYCKVIRSDRCGSGWGPGRSGRSHAWRADCPYIHLPSGRRLAGGRWQASASSSSSSSLQGLGTLYDTMQGSARQRKQRLKAGVHRCMAGYSAAARCGAERSVALHCRGEYCRSCSLIAIGKCLTIRFPLLGGGATPMMMIMYAEMR